MERGKHYYVDINSKEFEKKVLSVIRKNKDRVREAVGISPSTKKEKARSRLLDKQCKQSLRKLLKMLS